jgi:hypothetical protein
LNTKPPSPASDLLEVTTRNRAAMVIVSALAAENPARIWELVTDALADTPALANEITNLRTRVADERLDRANLAAAALATISAHRDREPDPLSYLRDELAAQGHDFAGPS